MLLVGQSSWSGPQLRSNCWSTETSAETILTLKNRESIHFAKFVHDTCADTFFWRIDSFHESILGKIRHISKCKGCQICIMKAEKDFFSFEKWSHIMKDHFLSTFMQIILVIKSIHKHVVIHYQVLILNWEPKHTKNRFFRMCRNSISCIDSQEQNVSQYTIRTFRESSQH